MTRFYNMKYMATTSSVVTLDPQNGILAYQGLAVNFGKVSYRPRWVPVYMGRTNVCTDRWNWTNFRTAKCASLGPENSRSTF